MKKFFATVSALFINLLIASVAWAQENTAEKISSGVVEGGKKIWETGKGLLGMGKGAIGIGGKISSIILTVFYAVFKIPQTWDAWLLLILMAIPFMVIKPLRDWLASLFAKPEHFARELVGFFKQGFFGGIVAIFVLWQSPELFLVILVFYASGLAYVLTVVGIGFLVAQTTGWSYAGFFILATTANLILLIIALVRVYKQWSDFKQSVKDLFSGKGRVQVPNIVGKAKCHSCGYGKVPVFEGHSHHPNGVATFCPNCGSRQGHAAWVDVVQDSDGKVVASHICSWDMARSPFSGQPNPHLDPAGDFIADTPAETQALVDSYQAKKQDGWWNRAWAAISGALARRRLSGGRGRRGGTSGPPPYTPSF